ncbi:IS66 family insertion sequence element accessory protein TnpB [Acidovorax sp. SUPP3334]|uniref:IS66 family insertion sequence element accessory protein TnpB n=1 Tax=Acidovorax sp. SUPP3334 TaxID=2920881 RepID=UPI0023DE4404|nr:IS66 family insertion sequence element accessory protein TnpB [Acidovorax sp. SUPP3334]GKT27146.1 hypothetical protein AVHM3334_22870 [Acidovorax sp. SUPP3334]
MFRFDPDLKVYLHRDAIDFRVGLNGLAIVVEQALGMDPFAQAVYVFRRPCKTLATRMDTGFSPVPLVA